MNREELPERSKPLPNMTAVNDIAKKRTYPMDDLVRGIDERLEIAAVVVLIHKLLDDSLLRSFDSHFRRPMHVLR